MQKEENQRELNAIRLSCEVRREKTLFGKVIQAMIANPKRLRLIAKAFNLTTQNIYSIGFAFIYGTKWEEGQKGGRKPLINESQREHIKIEVDRSTQSGNRPTFDEFVDIVRRVRAVDHRERLIRAELLGGTSFIAHAMDIPKDPSQSWFYAIIHDLGLRLANACEVTPDMVCAATRSNFRHWFTKVYTEEVARLFRAATIFNADELNLNFDMSSKVVGLKTEKRIPAQSTENFNGHITAMVTVGAKNPHPPLFIIIGGKEKPEDLSDIVSDDEAIVYYGGSGWMTREIFRKYSEMFVSWIQKQREEGKINRDEPVLLFLDSHSSRGDPVSLEVYQAENVMVITFPGQVTHVIQPFDVGIAGPMRVYYRKILRKLKLKAKEESKNKKLSEHEKRRLMIQALVEASMQATIGSNVAAAFHKTGLWPRNIDMTLSSPYVENDDEYPKHPNGRYPPRSPLVGRIITDDSFIEELRDREREASETRDK